MSATTPRCYDEVAKYNDNLLPRFATFETTHVWENTEETEGGALTVSHDADVYYKADKSLKIVIGEYTGVVETGGTEMNATLNRTGKYILSARTMVTEAMIGKSGVLTCQIFKNDVHESDLDVVIGLADDNFYEFGQWNTFYGKMDLEADDVIDLKFHVSTEDTAFTFYIDGLKLEFDDKACHEPTIYTYPVLVVEA